MEATNPLWTAYQDVLTLLQQDTFRLKDNIPSISNARQKILPYLEGKQLQHLTNTIKTKLQREANMAHKAAGRIGLVCMATGVGKSKTAIDAVSSLMRFKADAKILLVVPTTKLRDEGWKDEFEQWGCGDLFERVKIVCYDSLHKIWGHEIDFVIYDEAHNIVPSTVVFSQKNNIKACMALTATFPKKKDKIALLQELNLWLIYEITLDEAVDLGVVAPYEITLVGVELDNIKRRIKAGSKDKPFMQTERQAYNYFKKVEGTGHVDQFFFIRRMKFIYNLESKTEAATALLKLIPDDVRTIIFSGSTTQADALCEHRYHSKTKSTDYERFQRMEINRMSCVNSLNEGNNLRQTDCGFVVQLNSVDLNLIQRIGRIIRFRLNHVGKIIILYAIGTVDESWVSSAIEGLDEKRIKRLKLSDLLTGATSINF